jgi:hypothetical protein
MYVRPAPLVGMPRSALAVTARERGPLGANVRVAGVTPDFETAAGPMTFGPTLCGVTYFGPLAGGRTARFGAIAGVLR